MNHELLEDFSPLSHFTGPDLTQTLRNIETAVLGLSTDGCVELLKEIGANQEALAAAAEIKRLAAQIDVTIHALGILSCLPHILEPGERVEYVSLGAGNTGREFDLETNFRVAEFKFIRWRGGPESIRQNQVFKDFFTLAESNTAKRKYLYLYGLHQHSNSYRAGSALTAYLVATTRCEICSLRASANSLGKLVIISKFTKIRCRLKISRLGYRNWQSTLWARHFPNCIRTRCELSSSNTRTSRHHVCRMHKISTIHLQVMGLTCHHRHANHGKYWGNIMVDSRSHESGQP